MTITTATSLTELVETETIDMVITEYQADMATIAPMVRYKTIVGVPTNVASFPRWVKDAHEDVAESASMTPAEMETTDVQVTCARVGIAREPTETALEDTILGRAALFQRVAIDAATLFALAIDEDLAAQFANATNTVADSGNDLEILDLVEAMGLQRAAKAHGPLVFNLHDVQLKDLQRAQVAATATPWAAYYAPNADSTAFGGYFMNAPIFASSLNPTANAGADRVGALHVIGQLAPEYAAFALVVKRMPRTVTESNALADTTIITHTMRYGTGAIATNFATSITTDA